MQEGEESGGEGRGGKREVQQNSGERGARCWGGEQGVGEGEQGMGEGEQGVGEGEQGVGEGEGEQSQAVLLHSLIQHGCLHFFCRARRA